jgi:hypothetical protein
VRVALVAGLLLGCASTAPITGDFDDYAAYRRARLAMTREQRLGASLAYLDAFPRGDFREEIRDWFVPAESRYFRLAQDNPERLRAYLQVMPHGPHAEQVAARLAELATRRVFAERRDARALAQARGVQSALADAAAARHEFLAEWLALVELVAGVRTFGEPTSALASDLIWQFRLREPRGRCVLDRCQKAFSFEYAVPEAKQLAARRADFDLLIELERGQVRSVALRGNRLFSRVAEAAEVRALGAGAEDRSAALERAVQLVRDVIESTLPESKCAADSGAGYLLVRRCNGVRFELASTSDGLDTVRVSADPQR